MQKYQTNPDWETVYKINSQLYSNVSQSWKTKTELSQIREDDWETWQLHAIWDPAENPGGKKDFGGKAGQF